MVAGGEFEAAEPGVRRLVEHASPGRQEWVRDIVAPRLQGALRLVDGDSGMGLVFGTVGGVGVF